MTLTDGRFSVAGDSDASSLWWASQVKGGFHDRLPAATMRGVLRGLKTWLETGQLLTTPGSLMYDD